MALNQSARHRGRAALAAISLLAAVWAPAVLAAAAWQEGSTYNAGTVVTYNGRDYQATVTHTAYVGANWNPASTPTLWQDLGTANATPTPHLTPIPLTPPPTPCPTCNDVLPSSPPITPIVTPPITPLITPVTGSCKAAWVSGNVYTGGNQVSYNGVNYEAKWWTQGDNPSQSGDWGVWKSLGNCNGVTPVTLQADESVTFSSYPQGCWVPNPQPAALPPWRINVTYGAGQSVQPASGSLSALWQGVTRGAYLRAAQSHVSSAANEPKQVSGSWQIDRAYWKVVAVVPTTIPCPPTPTPTVTGTPTPTPTITPTPTTTPTPTQYCPIPTSPLGMRNVQTGPCSWSPVPMGNTVQFEQAAVTDQGAGTLSASWQISLNTFSFGLGYQPAIWKVFSTDNGQYLLGANGSITNEAGLYKASQSFTAPSDKRYVIQVCNAGYAFCVLSPALTPASVTPVTPTPTPMPCPTLAPPPPGFTMLYGDPAYPCGRVVPAGNAVNFVTLSANTPAAGQLAVNWSVDRVQLGFIPGYWRVFDDAGRSLYASASIAFPPPVANGPEIFGGGQTFNVSTAPASYRVQVCVAESSSTCVLSPVMPLVQDGLPKHALIGYWHNFTNPSGPTIRIRDVSDDWDVIMLSFGEDGGNGAVTFTLDPNGGTEAEFIADIAAKRAKGKKVVLSLGGQEGRMTLNTRENVTNFVNSLHGIINKYGLDGIDLDLESGAGVVLGTPIINNLITAMKELKAKVGPTFYLSMAPEHPYVQGGYVAYSGIWGAYLPIIDGLRDDLNMIHVQYYNNGGLYSPYANGALNEGTVDALVGGSLMLIEGFKTVGGTGWEFKGLRPDQVAFGVPSGSRSANTGFVTSATVSNALNCLTKLQNCGTVKPKQAYPTYRGVMTWSINWDRTDGFNFSKPTKAALNALP
ncbi:carbohydrate-binding protein [Chitinolyticbacter meiyuanensis]|uniref:carbohydrate-binding protein n=1 Tax=Chitinolyticbacter meiyuanensis TaxID=682798 RepID=UPI0027E45612|nr:carbohydrate-binding protein [Chitinolyticbacter meiyuanensis]